MVGAAEPDGLNVTLVLCLVTSIHVCNYYS